MANNKKTNAKKETVGSPALSDASKQEKTSDAVKETASGQKPAAAKDSKKEKSKGKGKEVIKAQARAKDPKKANKKPNIFQRFAEYIKQVRIEIKRTTWPTRNEVVNLTIIVLVALLFFGVLIFILDYIMVALLNVYSQFAPDAVASAANSGVTGGQG